MESFEKFQDNKRIELNCNGCGRWANINVDSQVDKNANELSCFYYCQTCEGIKCPLCVVPKIDATICPQCFETNLMNTSDTIQKLNSSMSFLGLKPSNYSR